MTKEISQENPRELFEKKEADMTKVVLQGDVCKCTNGTVPCPLNITNRGRMTADGRAIALKTDATIANLSTFGLCNNLVNPTVAGATAAAQGVLTPMPCIPVLTGVWNGTVTKLKIDGQPVVGAAASAVCAYGGNISISLVGKREIESE